jgi:hypothetical protein
MIALPIRSMRGAFFWLLIALPKQGGHMSLITLDDALAHYLTTITPRKKGRAQEARRIRAWRLSSLADRELNSLRGVDFARYRDSRLAHGMSNNTVRLELAIISHVFTVAIKDWGRDTAVP